MPEKAPGEAQPSPPSRRRAILGFVVFVLLIAGAFAALRWTPLAAYADKDTLTAFLDRVGNAWWAPLAFLGLYLVAPPLGLPVSPLIISGAVVFGAFWGSVYNYIGCVLGAGVSFHVARGLGRSFVEHIAGNRLERVEKLIDRHGFWSLVRLRFLPIPFPLVNFGAALMGVRPAPFHISTILGHLLPIPIWTYFWASLFGAAAGTVASAGRNLAGALGLFLLLSFAPRLWQRWRRRRRLRELMEMRARRRADG